MTARQALCLWGRCYCAPYLPVGIFHCHRGRCGLYHQTQNLVTNPPPSPDAAPDNPGPSLSVDELKRFVGDDPESIREFLVEFQKSARKHAEVLNVAMTTHDLAQVAMTAHTLKSTARVGGATPLGDLLAELENAARQQDIPGVDRYFGAFLTEFPRVERRLAELLAVR